jgi:hypothetical protein
MTTKFTKTMTNISISNKDDNDNDDNDDNDENNDCTSNIHGHSPNTVSATTTTTTTTKTTTTTDNTGALAHIDFMAYYFDGCGGFVPHIVDMVTAALSRPTFDSTKPMALGYSLLGGNKDVIGKELIVSQTVTKLARQRGMTVIHALDDPSRYGLSSNVKKVNGPGGGGTFTTWLLLQPEK